MNFKKTIPFLALLLLAISCSQPSDAPIGNNDPALLGKWVRSGRWHLELYANGIGSKKKGVAVTDDIKKHKKSRINWVTHNNNFLLINSDEKVMGFSYHVSGDTLFIRQPGDNLEYFLRVKD